MIITSMEHTSDLMITLENGKLITKAKNLNSISESQKKQIENDMHALHQTFEKNLHATKSIEEKIDIEMRGQDTTGQDITACMTIPQKEKTTRESQDEKPTYPKMKKGFFNKKTTQ